MSKLNKVERLNAAAPDLLKSLKKLDKILVNMIYAQSIRINEDFINVRTYYLAAIAKAEGR